MPVSRKSKIKRGMLQSSKNLSDDILINNWITQILISLTFLTSQFLLFMLKRIIFAQVFISNIYMHDVASQTISLCKKHFDVIIITWLIWKFVKKKECVCPSEFQLGKNICDGNINISTSKCCVLAFTKNTLFMFF